MGPEAKGGVKNAIDLGLAHLGRFAFFTRDNPFVSSQAPLELSHQHRSTLERLLEGTLDLNEWLHSRQAQDLLGKIKAECVPREVQVVSRDSGNYVAIGSVHSFLHAHQFWWLVSILWCMELGRLLDGCLAEDVLGYRLHPEFVEDPSSHGTMFRNERESYASWRRVAKEAAKQYPGQGLAATTIDLKDFFYSVQEKPSAIVKRFKANLAPNLTISKRSLVLTSLLDVLHKRYARGIRALDPRPPTSSNQTIIPLPVGLPSSQVLANLVMSLIVRDLDKLEPVVVAASYADDIVVISTRPPEPKQDAKAYLRSLGVVSDADILNSSSAVGIAGLLAHFEKSSTVYVRAEEEEEEEESSEAQEATFVSYVDGNLDPDWGGKLNTVLRAPFKRDRVPYRLVKETRKIVEEIRVGVGADETAEKLRELVDSLDVGQFLSIRPFWTDLVVGALSAHGMEGASMMTHEFLKVIAAVEPPAEANEKLKKAVYAGLRAAWIQALAQAMAAALSSQERQEFIDAHEWLLDNDERVAKVSGKEVVEYANRIRRRHLIPPSFVACPLAEFTSWDGQLIGRGAFDEFVAWTLSKENSGDTRLKDGLKKAVRFVPLHEICLAQHLWAAVACEQWLESTFELFAEQPLVYGEALSTLKAEAQKALGELPSSKKEVEDDDELCIRIGLPNIPVREDLLKLAVSGDSVKMSGAASDARNALISATLSAVKQAVDLLVLPEWSIPPQNLPWLMDQSRRSSMLVVGGESPYVQGGMYSNRLWVGLPVADAQGRRSCIVPPPRLKKHLSPEEIRALREYGLREIVGGSKVVTYRWRGFGIASLICFEFADVGIRESLRVSADVITVSSLNRDWRYFNAVQEATSRDNFCLTVCVNTAAYPGTRIMRPTVSEKSIAASVHGAMSPTVVSRDVDLQPIVQARNRGQSPRDFEGPDPRDDLCRCDYKAFSPAWI